MISLAFFETSLKVPSRGKFRSESNKLSHSVAPWGIVCFLSSHSATAPISLNSVVQPEMVNEETIDIRLGKSSRLLLSNGPTHNHSSTIFIHNFDVQYYFTVLGNTIGRGNWIYFSFNFYFCLEFNANEMWYLEIKLRAPVIFF